MAKMAAAVATVVPVQSAPEPENPVFAQWKKLVLAELLSAFAMQSRIEDDPLLSGKAAALPGE